MAQEQTLRELELRVRQQSAEAEKGNLLRQRLAQEKAKLEIQVAAIGAELQEAKRRCVETGAGTRLTGDYRGYPVFKR